MNSASNGPYLPRIEWEALQNKWEIEDLKESPALPPGAERITVWRNDQYKLEAQVTGTPVGRAKDMLPNFGPPGTMFPDLDVEGSSTGGRVEYKLSHCVPGRISVKGGESFEAELTTYRVQRTYRRREPKAPVWLTEWYLNAYRGRSFIYTRSVHREFKEKYRKKRDFLGADITIGGQDMASTSQCAFVETPDVCFIIDPVPDGLGPPWSKCLGIEYREDLGGIPDADVREAVAEIVSFVMGRPLEHVGYTSFDERSWPIEEIVISPISEDLPHICRRPEQSPVMIDKAWPTDDFESVLQKLIPKYLERRDKLDLDQALWGYWISERAPLGANLPELATSIEIIKKAWFRSSGSKSRGVYIPKKEFDELLASELAALDAKLEGVAYGDRMSSRIRNAFNMGVNESLKSATTGTRIPTLTLVTVR